MTRYLFHHPDDSNKVYIWETTQGKLEITGYPDQSINLFGQLGIFFRQLLEHKEWKFNLPKSDEGYLVENPRKLKNLLLVKLKVIGMNERKKFIQTIRMDGYKWLPKVERTEDTLGGNGLESVVGNVKKGSFIGKIKKEEPPKSIPTLKNDYPFVFLCHAHEDKTEVLKVRAMLEAFGIKTWVDKVNLIVGQNWKVEIHKALKKSDFALVFLSNASVTKRGYVQKEFKLALEIMEEMPLDKIFIIPVKLDDCQVPHIFDHLHWIHLREEKGFEKILTAIQT